MVNADIQFLPMKDTDELPSRRVWDLPVRVFHWLLVACFTAAWFTRDARLLDLHVAAGYGMALLLVFRMVWGLVGSRPARFASFVRSPAAALDYLRLAFSGTAPRHLSHNPAGGWSVLLLLGLGLALTVAGPLLLSAQHGFGPFADRVPASAAAALRLLHETLAWALLGLVGLHLAGVAFGSWTHRENLVAAMLSGHKAQVPATAAQVPAHAAIAVLLAGAVAVTAAATLQRSGWLDGYATLRRDTQASLQSVAAPAWREECASCHFAYPPELLPTRSWSRLLDEQQQHFGEDLGLSAAATQALREAAAGADQARRWAGLALRASVAANDAPQRITETPMWRERHEAIDAAVFKAPTVAGRHNCEACHLDAASAIFSPRVIRIPE